MRIIISPAKKMVVDTDSFAVDGLPVSAFIMSLASSALVCLGEVPDPDTGTVSKNLQLARHNIDILEMLRQKTSANINSDEAGLLDNVLCELRLKYVIISGK